MTCWTGKQHQLRLKISSVCHLFMFHMFSLLCFLWHSSLWGPPILSLLFLTLCWPLVEACLNGTRCSPLSLLLLLPDPSLSVISFQNIHFSTVKPPQHAILTSPYTSQLVIDFFFSLHICWLQPNLCFLMTFLPQRGPCSYIVSIDLLAKYEAGSLMW